METLIPLMPAAGLAAPQIGISCSIFIFSYDRDPAHLEIVINPTFVPIGEKKIVGWEGCFSTILVSGVRKVALVPRYEKIAVAYWTLDGVLVDRVLEGFAAKVFQHEYDHLRGMTNIYRDDAEVKEFATHEELNQFMVEVKKEDSKRYLSPKRGS
jgi:peptide deformylase